MALAALVDDVAVVLDAVSSDVNVAPMAYPLMVRSPADMVVGALVEAARFFVET
jgi:hypothetical protein